MDRQDSLITFPDVDSATAGRYAQELRNRLLNASRPGAPIQATLERDDADALDLGAVVTVSVHVVTPVVAHVIASTIFKWWEGRTTKIKVKNGVFELIVGQSADEDFVKRLVAFLTADSHEDEIAAS